LVVTDSSGSGSGSGSGGGGAFELDNSAVSFQGNYFTQAAAGCLLGKDGTL
jgi:hypothetical protein